MHGELSAELSLCVNCQNPRITIDTDESYSLDIVYDAGEGVVTGTALADNVYGLRHAFETFFQAIDYDDVSFTYHL